MGNYYFGFKLALLLLGAFVLLAMYSSWDDWWPGD